MSVGYHLLQSCFLLLAIRLGFAELALPAAKCRPSDQSALLSFRKTLVHSPYSLYDCSTWDEKADCCSWKGVDCHSSTGSVVSIAFENMCYEGTSASFSSNSSLFHLPSLQRLFLSGLSLPQYTIPNEIARLSRLKWLFLHSTNLTGTIPDAIGNLTMLKYLVLFNTDLSGSIPLALSKLTKLVYLDIRECKLTGSIPGALFSNPHLETLSLSGNQLSGSLPAAISGPSRLVHLDLSSNNLEGTIPSWLFEIQSRVYLHNNRLGPLETFRLQKRNSLNFLDLSFNRINGPFPSSLFQLSNLTDLSLRATQLTGVVEWNNFKNMVNLTSLDLSENRGLTLKNSNDEDEAVNLRFFQSLEIASCGVTEFPNYLRRLENLYRLDVSDNKIGGVALKGGGWEHLSNFNGSHNQITAFEFPNNSDLYTFDLSYNLLKGALPKPPISLSLWTLFLSNNQLSGGILTEFCKTRFQLDLSSNNFEGFLPSCFNSSPDFASLNLKNNRFTGVIPSTIGNIYELIFLDLSKNHLTGRIPPSLTGLLFLRYLNLSYNNLDGPIPPLYFPNSSSYIGNPGLCGPPLSKGC